MNHLLQLDPTALETELRSLGETNQVSEAPASNEGGNQVSEAPGSWRASVAPGGPPWEHLDSGDSLEGLAELRAVLRLFTRELEAVKTVSVCRGSRHFPALGANQECVRGPGAAPMLHSLLSKEPSAAHLDA